ncbi:MAG TPA: alkaline phosphatase family protein [Gemmataceae bacterium]|nr:alkaline phosphatase family protein [Gemmataceae bacterium]
MAVAFLSVVASSFAAEPKTRNVFLLTTDGLRWQEVFAGAEEALMDKENGGVAKTNELRAAYWRPTPEARREALMPFLWGKVAKEGQLWGNRNRNSVVRVANGYNFSYPGYSEFLTGVADARIDSNDPKPNPNVNVFQWLNGKPAFRDKVGAVVSWGVIPWILNADAAGFPVWSAFDLPAGAKRSPLSAAAQELLDRTTPIWADVSLDTFSATAAKEMVRRQKPRALYVAFGETDDWAHEGRYDRVLHAAHNFDRFVGELWTMVQAMPQYRDRTTFVVATDHGRGPAPVAWKSHGKAITESAYIWIGILGPDTPALGERQDSPVATQGQIAATVAALLGEDFNHAFPKAAQPLSGVLKK